jgi:hypothetical protein
MQLTRPVLPREAVIAEALLLLRRGGIKPDGLLNIISRGLVVPQFQLASEILTIQHLMKTYGNIPTQGDPAFAACGLGLEIFNE